ncbi:MAG: PepSY domain-containing protein [Nitrospirales bacterium]|nr:PepSY domain-containing protein [Nitrospira sp.]MDR4461489.1 PepSY domain-containing protein [Nitrospirales bacterium]MDR4481686.1 PepSY domain-containing protein [Nitrospirales bacterium]
MSRVINTQTGQPLTLQDTHGGEFFYRFHYQLSLDQVGICIVGATAMAMLVALVTGIVIPVTPKYSTWTMP